VTGISLTSAERQLLEDLEAYVLWAGRYPRPRRADGLVSIGHSPARHDAELALGQKLYDYLQALCPDIEPDTFLLPHIETENDASNMRR
jgi:hypothetical protein